MSDIEDVPNVEEPDTTELTLWTWGLSGQPSSWALPTWTPLIDVIRMANQGAASVAAVQDVLDATFPDAGYVAANIVLAHPPVGDFTVESTGGRSVHVQMASDEDLLLPEENVQWDWGDGQLQFDAGCPDHEYAEDGDYGIKLYITVGGVRYGSGQLVTIGDVLTPTAGKYDPAAHTVDEVLAYVAKHPEQTAAIIEAEEAGKNRITLLEKL